MARDAAFTVRVTPELKAKLQALAKADRRTLSKFVELVLEQAAATPKPKPRKK